MAHLLIADSDADLRQRLRTLLEPRAHHSEEARTALEAIDEIAHQASIQDPFDLLLLGEGLGETADALMRRLGVAACDHRVVVLAGQAVRDASLALGALAAVAPGADDRSVITAVEAALARRSRYLGRLAEWDLAEGLMARLASDPAVDAGTHDVLIQAARAERGAAVGAAGPDEASVMAALDAVEARVNASLAENASANFEDCLAPFARYRFTASFERELRALFATERIRFWALAAELMRLSTDLMAHGRLLGDGHFAYPIGGRHQVYFRWEDGVRTLEAFGLASEADPMLGRLATAEPGYAVPVRSLA